MCFALGCTAETLDRDDLPANEDRFAGTCSQYLLASANCLTQGVIWGTVGAAGGTMVGTLALPVVGTVSGAAVGATAGATGGFLSCIASYGFDNGPELWAAGLQCGANMVPNASGGEITGNEAVGCSDDVLTECRRIVSGRTVEVEECAGPCDVYVTVQRECSSWRPECHSAMLTCIANTQENCSEDDVNGAGASLRADVNGDASIDGHDVAALRSFRNTAPGLADIDGNGVANDADRDHLVHHVMGVPYGDANLDGQFDSTDLAQVFAAGKYEVAEPAQWSEGDFNGDSRFDSADLVLANTDDCYDQGPDCIVSQYE